jgi:hypothetical protein
MFNLKLFIKNPNYTTPVEEPIESLVQKLKITIPEPPIETKPKRKYTKRKRV